MVTNSLFKGFLGGIDDEILFSCFYTLYNYGGTN